MDGTKAWQQALFQAESFQWPTSLDLLFKIYLFISVLYLCISVLPKYMYVYHRHAWCLRRPERSVGPPETGVTDG